ncbi:hypothetical protein MIND_01364600 [Mycena indigotica]|uniref:Uncharacterized protein n=1 Tax=Mycena indigotica TaxID=2126181 RepID=A0A8H6S067_9AGAR|nr:uncharacterized protein MIND_01364600 [Mycena indigotica]KAF7289898.1 hypothetical protein MIND_01364600 [Mycena indigotica]
MLVNNVLHLLSAPLGQPKPDRKNRSSFSKPYKPKPLISALQRFVRTERSSSPSPSPVSDGEDSSSSSSDVSQTEANGEGSGAPVPPTITAQGASWEGTRDVPNIKDSAFMFHELSDIRLSYRRPIMADVMHHPDVHRRLQFRRLRDARAVGTAASAVPFTVQPTRSLLKPISHITRTWLRLQRIAEDILEDAEMYHHLVYAQTPVGKYEEYRHRWDLFVERRPPAPLLRFADVPWPVDCGRVFTREQITAGQIHRFLVRPNTCEELEWAAVHRLELEIDRWSAVNVAQYLLPRVAKPDHDCVSDAAKLAVVHMANIREELLHHFTSSGLSRAHLKLQRWQRKQEEMEAAKQG